MATQHDSNMRVLEEIQTSLATRRQGQKIRVKLYFSLSLFLLKITVYYLNLFKEDLESFIIVEAFVSKKSFLSSTIISAPFIANSL